MKKCGAVLAGIIGIFLLIAGIVSKMKKAVAFSIAYGTLEEIEELNILEATFLAMNRAIEGLPKAADYALIDGNRVPKGIKVPCDTVVKGDSKSFSIAAASILAKVSRDRFMLEIDKQYPECQFSKHKGYGTKSHIEKIKEIGPCKLHRKTFIKNFLLLILYQTLRCDTSVIFIYIYNYFHFIAFRCYKRLFPHR